MEVFFQFLGRSINATLKLYETKLKSFFTKFKNAFRKVGQILSSILREIIAYLFGRPTSLKDYFKSGGIYISKQFLFRVVFMIVFLFFLVGKVVIPYLDGRVWTATVPVNSNKFHDFTGKAEVVTREGKTIYRGTMEEGTISGTGEVYEDGHLVYKGEWSENQYHGEGMLYDEGVLVYQGGFIKNQYSGEGILYYQNGKVKYKGAFLEGEFQEGSAYYPNGYLKYHGAYDKRQYSGEGKLYSSIAENSLLYDGDFEKGLYHGQGRQYEKNKLVYEGGFLKGKRSGEGIFYSLETERPIYMGAFSANQYSGEGRLFDPDTGRMRYEGGFLENNFDGTGRLYQKETGRIVYEGGFQKGVYQGEGALYGNSGAVLYTGTFFDGEIQYAGFFGADRDTIQKAFGQESNLYLLENSFLLVYSNFDIAFEFSYVQEEKQPVANKIKFFGDQTLYGVSNKMTVQDVASRMQEKTFTEYSFVILEEEELFFQLADAELEAGDTAYSAKYLLEDFYIRIFAPSNSDRLCYFEIGGV